MNPSVRVGLDLHLYLLAGNDEYRLAHPDPAAFLEAVSFDMIDAAAECPGECIFIEFAELADS